MATSSSRLGTNIGSAPRAFRSRWRVFAFVLLFCPACGDSGGGTSPTSGSGAPSFTSGSVELTFTVGGHAQQDNGGFMDPGASSAPPVSTTAVAATDADLYLAADIGTATVLNISQQSLYLPGCAPFVLEQSVNGDWVDLGPPITCIWEGLAVIVGVDEADVFEFAVPADSGFYRLEYRYGLGCEEELPLSQANCTDEDVAYSNVFEVERELCEPTEPVCGLAKLLVPFQCPDGVNYGGLADECTLDPWTGECGFEFFSCP